MTRYTLRFLSLLIISFTVISSAFAQGYFQRDLFGKNRVQYDKFKWSMIESPHFELYYYDMGFTVAKLGGEIAERELQRITELIGYSPYYKTKLLIYGSVKDLRQSNIGIYHQNYGRSGQTNFVRAEVEVAFNGNKYEFEREIKNAIADAFLFEMMYGGTFANMVKTSHLLNLPNWFMSGASDYIANPWSIEMDDHLRDFFERQKGKKLTKIQYLEDDEARLVGHSVWNYLVEKYGKSNMASVLNLTRIVRDEKLAIQNTLGIEYDDFIENWKQFYFSQYSAMQQYEEIDTEKSLYKNKKQRAYNKLKFSPDGSKFALTQNDKGKYSIKIYDLKKKKKKIIFKSGYKVVNQKVDYDIPLVEWINEDEIVVFSQRKGKNYMWIYNLSKGGFLEYFRYVKKKIEFNFDHINDISISPNGKRLAISAERRGQSDIYEHNIPRRRTRQLTKDPFDDITPYYMPDGVDIVFSSNRTNDSIKIAKSSEVDLSPYFHIYKYKRKEPTVLEKVTNDLGSDYYPHPISKDEIVYLSDKTGVTNLYYLDTSDSVNQQITNYKFSMLEFDLAGDKILYNIKSQESEKIYYEDFNPLETHFTPKTSRQQILDLRYLQALKKKRQEEEKRAREAEKRRKEAEELRKRQEELRRMEEERLQKEIEEKRKRDEQMLQEIEDFDWETWDDSSNVDLDSLKSAVIDSLNADSLKQEIQPEGKINLDEQEIELDGKTVVEENQNVPQPNQQVLDPLDEEIDFENYVFEREKKNEKSENNNQIDSDLPPPPSYDNENSSEITDAYQFDTFSKDRRQSFINMYRQRLESREVRKKPKSLFTRSKDYKTRFAADQLVSDFRVDPLRGMGLVFTTNLTDVLENHKINAGIFGAFNLDDATFFAEYLYMRKRFDFGVKYERNDLAIDANEQKYALNHYEASISYPFSIRSRITVAPFFANTRFTDTSLAGLSDRDILRFYAGGRFEYVFDNSIERGKNMLTGTRFKINYTNYIGTSSNAPSFQKFFFDFRHYQKILRSITLAIKFSGGQFFGESPNKFRLGGINDWLFNRMDNDPRAVPENQPINNPDLTHLLFTEFVGPLRGFNYNKKEEESFAALSVELRFPVVKFFTKKTIKSNILRNLQLTGFYDMGSAWTGNTPFNEVNSINVIDVPRVGSFSATVKNFQEPFLVSFGPGIRTTLLGYYLKLDVAWTVEDGFRREKPRAVLSLGHDF